jgi:hypothetical protein
MVVGLTMTCGETLSIKLLTFDSLQPTVQHEILDNTSRSCVEVIEVEGGLWKTFGSGLMTKYIKIRNFRNFQLTTHHTTTTHNPQPTTHNPQPTTHNPQPTTHNPQPTTHKRKRMWRELRTVIQHAAYCPRLLLLTAGVIVATRDVVPLHAMSHYIAFACLNVKKLTQVQRADK